MDNGVDSRWMMVWIVGVHWLVQCYNNNNNNKNLYFSTPSVDTHSIIGTSRKGWLTVWQCITIIRNRVIMKMSKLT